MKLQNVYHVVVTICNVVLTAIALLTFIIK